MTEGVIAGYPMVDVKVAVYDGSMHAVDSNEMAFKTAARIGFRAAAEKADLVLLEPIATLTIDVPEAYAGAVMGDMSSLRGRVLGMEMVDGMQLIKAQASRTPRSSTTRRSCARSRTAPAPTRSRSASTSRSRTTWPRRSSTSTRRTRPRATSLLALARTTQGRPLHGAGPSA